MISDDVLKAAIAAFRTEVKLHAACAMWPEMDPKELLKLGEDIVASGLRDPVALTPIGELLDGRNRWKASLMVGVEIPDDKITVFDGDPWLFSISRNARRRHMSVDEIAMVVASMPMKEVGANQYGEGGSFEPPSIAEVAKEAGVPETAIKSAKTVLAHGTEQEKADVRSGKLKVRKAADQARVRVRAGPIRSLKKSGSDNCDPTQALAAEIEKAFDDSEWRTIDKAARFLSCAQSAFQQALKALGGQGRMG
jgi:hypothetical protein